MKAVHSAPAWTVLILLLDCLYVVRLLPGTGIACSKSRMFRLRRQRLRDQVAAIYNRVGNVKNGERVEIIDREKRFARVRTASGIEGWIEQRFLVDQKTYDGLQKLTHDNQNDPVQAPGVCETTPTCMSAPGRETDHFTSWLQERRSPS